MKMSRDTDTPGEEFRVAVAGPLVTLPADRAGHRGRASLLAGADSFWDAARLSATADATPAEVVVSLLVSMNLLLLVFNLVPAFPLDGGRIARAVGVEADRRPQQGDALRRLPRARLRLAADRLGGSRWSSSSTATAFDGIWFAVLGWLLGLAPRAATLAQTALHRAARRASRSPTSWTPSR